MQNGTENRQNDTGDNNNNSNTENNSQTGNATSKSEDPFEKHIDIAIEAQDGKKEETSAKASEGNDKSDEGEKANQQDGETKKQGDSTSGDGDGKSQQQSTEEKKEEGKQTHSPKDLKLQDGTVVRGGAERRFYEQRETARQERDHFKKQLETATNELERTKSELDTVKQSVESVHGMDPHVVSIGAKIVSDMQRDPIGTLKKLVAETAAQGYNVEDLGVGVDTAAIKRLLDERLPNNAEREPTEEEYVAEATREANTFFSQYPDARPHDTLLASLLRDHPGLDLHSAYFQLKNAFAEKGFDWSLSLEDNLKAQSDQSNNNGGGQQQNQQQQKNDNVPLPGARGNADSGEFKLNSGNGIAHEDMDTSDIVRQAMRESGMKI